MNVDELAGDIAQTLDAGRRRLASVDLGGFRASARAAALGAWPMVGGLLVIGAVLAGWLFLVPAFRAKSMDSDASPKTAADPRSGASRALHPGTPADQVSGDDRKENPDGEDQDI
jgi:hypothetical protein